MSDNTSVTEVTETSQQTQDHVTTKTYTQEEFDRHMAGLKTSLTKKFQKQFEELGDIEELKSIKAQWDQRKTEEAMKKGEFEKILQEKLSIKDAEIRRRDEIIQGYKVDMPLLEAATRYRAVAPEQVKSLLRNQVRLNAEGEVEVLDSQGSVRYDNSGKPVTVDVYVKEFLDSNRHFVQAAPATTSTKSSINALNSSDVDVTKLDLRNPAHRKLYAEMKNKKIKT